MKIRIYYEDTDCGGIVYHSNYLKFCERARSEFIFESGLNLFSDEAHFVVSKITANFKKPAKLGDMIEIKTKLLKLNHASMVLEQSIFRDDELLFQADITVAFLCGEKPCKLNEDAKNLFSKLIK